MSPKVFIILFVTTLISVAVAAYSISHEPGLVINRTGDVVFPKLLPDIDNVGKVAVTTNKRAMTMVRKNGNWVMIESDGYLVDGNKVKSAILGFSSLRYVDPKTRKKENYIKLDLRNPKEKEGRGRKVEIFDKSDKKLVDVILGRLRYDMPGTTKRGVYFRKPNKSQTWLGVGQLEISRLPEDWLEKKIINIPAKNIKKAHFSHSDGEIIKVAKVEGKESYILQNIPLGKKLKYDSDPKIMATVLENLELEDVRKSGSIKIDSSNSLDVNFFTTEGLDLNLRMVEIETADGNENWVRIKASASKQSLKKVVEKINKNTIPWVFKIPEYKASRLNKRLNQLLEDKKPAS